MANRTPTAFGALLKRYRMAALLTQEQLAFRAQLSPDTIRALEYGKRRAPRPDSIHALVEALALAGTEREALIAAAARSETAVLSENESASPAGVTLRLAQPGPLVGREHELETIRQRLVNDGSTNIERARLLTLTGPAGVGKTRLALAAVAQIASQFPDGAVLVDLTPVRDPTLVLPTVARAVGFADNDSASLLARLHDMLHERRMLLVLDNFEQVLPAAGALADLLANCLGLTLLVTSRIPLHLRWEWTLRVAPLPTPDLNMALPPLDALVEIPSVALFVERARAWQADFALSGAQAPLVARLTADLDGLPLAIELAAARLDGLGLSTIVRRLDDRLRLLRWEAPDAPKRQHSLAAAVGWSYDLLSASERQLFRCLGVFVGQVTLSAITAVAAAVAVGIADKPQGKSATPIQDAMDEEHVLEGLASLAEKSLVQPAGRLEHSAQQAELEESAGLDPTFRMLETVREYAWEQLATEGELEAAQRAHARYFQALAEQADPHLRRRDQRTWYVHLEREHNNLRAALRWLLDQDGPDAAAEREVGLRFTATLSWFWWTRGYIVEGWRWIHEALDRAPAADQAARLKALLGAGALLAYQGEFEQAKAVLEEALTLANQQQDPAQIAQAFSRMGLCAIYAGDVATSIPLLREALHRGRALGDSHLVGMTLLYLGAATFAQGNDEQAVSLYAESLASFELAGDKLFAVNVQLNLGWFAWRQGDLTSAIMHTRAGVEMSVTYENRRLLSFSAQMTLLLLGESGELPLRARLLGAIDTMSQATGMTLLQMQMKSSLAELHERLKGEKLEKAYLEGRSLPFDSVARLALILLDDALKAPRHTGPNIDTDKKPVKPRESSQQDTALSPRQQEVVRLVAQGLSNKAIGQQLFLSASTITYHLRAVFNKLGVSTRAQAVAVASQRGLL